MENHITNLFKNSDMSTTLLLKSGENPIARFIENSERIFLKIYLICFILIIAKIVLYYAVLKIKRWLYHGGEQKKKAHVNPYEQFKQPKSYLGFCIDYNLKDAMGKLDTPQDQKLDTIPKIVSVPEIKNKLTYYMQHKLLSRENVITLVTYLENYAPKEKGKKYKNDLHYLNSALKYRPINPTALKCFDELMDELAIPRLLEVCIKAEKTHKKARAKQLSQDKNVIDFLTYKNKAK